MTDYIIERKSRLRSKELGDLSLFALLGGLIFAFIGYRRFLVSYTELSGLISKILMLLGILLVLAGLIMPQAIGWFYKGFSFIGNHIGQLIFNIILSVIYVILIIPIGLIMARKKSSYDYVAWDDEYSVISTSGFTECKGMTTGKRSGFLGVFTGLIGSLAANGQYVLIPVVVILVALGIILFFVTSSVMAPFIYTLF